ncbi:MAG: hypothetical protein K6F00_05340 [Lachnospiraceae bacterium]|nr:hypothetical protein [Lachnospiraceae bacterium]
MGFNITSNSFLRSLYNDDRSFAKKSVRNNSTDSALLKADSKALKRGLRVIGAYDYGTNEKDSKNEKTEFFNNITAFTDVYNNTLKSSHDVGDANSKAVYKQLKKLSSKYAEELKAVGVKFDDNGYMNIKESSINNIDVSNYKDYFGSDSDFMKDLTKISKKLTRHIDELA